MNRRLLFILLIISPALSYSQFNARYGYKYATTDVLRLFIVFADVIDDPYQGNVNNWQPGQLPLYADSIIDENYGGNLVSYMSRYYREASCGLINIIGDYYPNLVQFSYSEIESVGYKQVADYLNSLSGNDITTAHGYHLSDFDQWSYGLTQRRNYRIKQNSPDNKMDMLIIIWRRNSKFKPNRDGGQCGTPKAIDTLCIKCLSGINGYAAICGNDIGGVMRHEFGHSLVGDNSYHSGGAGAGASGHFLPNVGGYSIISSHNRNLNFCNGWDRWWLGWKHPNKNYYISATDLLGDEVETDMVYGENLSTNDFILRDFATYGDAIRIKLPHLRHFNGQVRNQYLWIENHQITPGSVEYDATRPQDIRFNIQVGNDDLEQGFENSRTNYIVPLSAFGNYDFYFDTLPYDGSDPMDFTKRYVAIAYDSTANPFTGYHPAMMPAIDYNNNDTIQAKEHVVIRRLYRNGDLEIDKHTVYGNDYDAFHAGSKLSMSTNPPSTPLMTFRTEERPKGNELGSAFAVHEYDDNRYIWLNGLSVEIAEKYANGDIRVHIAWDDFKIRSDARWCGSIMLTETAELEQGLTLTLDHGLTPTRPCEPPERSRRGGERQARQLGAEADDVDGKRQRHHGRTPPRRRNAGGGEPPPVEPDGEDAHREHRPVGAEIVGVEPPVEPHPIENRPPLDRHGRIRSVPGIEPQPAQRRQGENRQAREVRLRQRVCISVVRHGGDYKSNFRRGQTVLPESRNFRLTSMPGFC